MTSLLHKNQQLHALLQKASAEIVRGHGQLCDAAFDRLLRHAPFFDEATLAAIKAAALGWAQRPFSLLCAYVVTIVLFVTLIKKVCKRQPGGKAIPAVQGGWPFLGQVFTMIKGSPWDTMAMWAEQYGGIYSFTLFGEKSISVSDPDLLRGILQTQHTIFKKDLEWTYYPFLEILGNGLVTSDGASWRRQRVLLSNHLRVEILEEIPEMAYRAVQRLSVKLDAAVKSGHTVEMAEEFRTLTLQVIAEALLSLDSSESDMTFAHMYLPIVEEGNLRVWNPPRMYNIFHPAFWRHLSAVKTLNDYVTKLINKRWAVRAAERQASNGGGGDGGTKRKTDVLDKVLGAIKQEDWDRDSVSITSQIRDEIKTFVLAGHETSASMLAWTLYELHAPSNGSSVCKTYKVCDDEGCFVLSAPFANNTNQRLRLLNQHDTVNVDGTYDQTSIGAGCGTYHRLSNGAGYILANNGKGVNVLQEVYGSSQQASCLDKVMEEAEKVYAGHTSTEGYVTSMPSRPVLAGERGAKGNEYRGLDYTECCLRESLRKYSVVPTVVRNVSQDTRIGEYFFSKGTKIMVNMQGAHHTAENWPEPKSFRPTRFSAQNLENIKPYTFIPFIDGPRNCLGQYLSLLESKCVLSMLIKRYRFVLTNPEGAGDKHPFMVPIIPGPGHHFKVYDR